MITCVDTNVLLDVFADSPEFAAESQRSLGKALDSGAVVICDVVYAELAPQFDARGDLDAALRALGVKVSETSVEAAYLAGSRWAEYRTRGGTRERILPDFLIGAHAAVRGDALLTRDRGFFASYFPELARVPAE